MVTLSPASIVVVPFPFSDLTSTKRRPAIVMSDTGYGDWLLCQITSTPYADSEALRLTNADLKKGTLNHVSYVRPMKLFTASEGLIVKRVAILNDKTFKVVLTMTIEALQKNMPK